MLHAVISDTLTPKGRTMSRRTRVTGITIFLTIVIVAVAYSHDVWLFPNDFILMRGDTLVIRQFAGTELETEHDVPLLRTMTPRFELVTPDTTIDLLGELPPIAEQMTVHPVLTRKLDFEGHALVTMEHDFIWQDFSRADFLHYLEHEAFDVARFRKHMGRNEREHERYARTLKCLIQVGSAPRGDLHRRVLGHKIEILLLQNPYALDPGDDLEVQVLFEGRPLADKTVWALSGGNGRPVQKARARTNTDGTARFRLDRPGAWLIRLVHLLPCAERDDIDCTEVDWESYWTSYSFALD